MRMWVVFVFARVLSVSVCVHKECVCACCIHVFACVPIGIHAQPHCCVDPGTWSCGSLASIRLLDLTTPNSPCTCGGFCRKLTWQKEKLGKKKKLEN